MKLVDMVIGALLGASTAAAAAVSGLSPSHANNSTVVKIPIPIPRHKPWKKYKITCVEPTKSTLQTNYNDYWHTIDIFCRFLADNKIEFEYGQTFGAEDSLCNSERCLFASAKYQCKDPQKATVSWDTCIKSMQYPYWHGDRFPNLLKDHTGPCIKGDDSAVMRGASTVEPKGCWNFSSEVHEPFD
ncbi:hypothetical protein CERZMDRAFT_97229 [Cercospora zeae-maydis SCOH1-5]|uniref:Ecp2 effector protein domain-containing protein n=1 Tax=Cercospora zeae-maydis SCOH1-5 TaxID=717836 RepID=A0A6A6FH70_9PEZI|nr:hypothetical protein CERZMDRAFT_97229 [Cercospora zeae-maydis SCOH1-5]